MLAICGKNTARQLQDHFCGLWMPQCIFFLYDFVFISIRIFHNKISERQQATICYCCRCRSHLIVTYDCLSGTIYSFVCRHSFQAVGSNIFRYIFLYGFLDIPILFFSLLFALLHLCQWRVICTFYFYHRHRNRQNHQTLYKLQKSKHLYWRNNFQMVN